MEVIAMSLFNWLTGVGMGAGMAYLFDPIQGNRRRALLRDQVLHGLTKSCAGADATWRDIRHRSYGTMAQMRGMVESDDASDEVITARVRSKIGRYVSHPSAIEVKTENSCVCVSGPILAYEVDDLLDAVASVKGVYEVENQLDVHETAENIPALQGGRRRRGEPAELMQEYWTPATRLAAGSLGAALMTSCLRSRNPISLLMGTAGFGLTMRALTNLEMKRVLGFGGGRRGIDIRKTIKIDRPVNEVFELLSDPTQYPKFTDMVRSVRDLGDGHYQKTMVGPGGAEMSITERITRLEPNEFLACSSGPDSPIKYSMTARFESVDDSATRVHLCATYNPPGGVIADALGRLTGYDMKSQLEDTLVRAKSFLETGRQPHDAAEKMPAEAAEPSRAW
jgi:uncharacterized membrane protein